jgi:hypothetical protein
MSPSACAHVVDATIWPDQCRLPKDFRDESSYGGGES